MGIRLEMLMREEYRIKGKSSSCLARRIDQLARESGQTAEDIFAKIADGNHYIYYSQTVIKQPAMLTLPREVFIRLVKKVALIVDACDEETANQTFNALLRLFDVANWDGKIEYSWRATGGTSMISVHLLFLGQKPLAADFFIDEIDEDEKGPSEIRRKPVKNKDERKHEEIQLLSPKEIYDRLGQAVLGQDEAKKSVAVILYQHMKSCELRKQGKGIKKTNALLIGPTGCGKSLLARTLADVCSLPFLKIDATNIVQRGYRGGMHVEQIADLLAEQANHQKKQAEQAVIFIDEIDKLAYRSDNAGELGTQGVQQDLLTLIDGGTIYCEEDHEEYQRTTFNYGNVLFLFGGAFSGLDKEGFVTHKDLAHYGFIPEFANRLGNIIKLDPIDDDLVRTLVSCEVAGYSDYLPMTSAEANVYTEIIKAGIVFNKSHLEMGGRCVGQAVRRFFEERIFEGGKNEKNK